ISRAVPSVWFRQSSPNAVAQVLDLIRIRELLTLSVGNIKDVGDAVAFRVDFGHRNLEARLAQGLREPEQERPAILGEDLDDRVGGRGSVVEIDDDGHVRGRALTEARALATVDEFVRGDFT